MDDPHTPLSEAIRLALEAAETATDAAAEVDRAARRLTEAPSPSPGEMDRRFLWLSAAALAVGVASSVAGGLLYLRADAQMATVTETQMEALKVFSQSVGQLTEAVKASTAAGEALTKAAATLTDQGKTVAEAASEVNRLAPDLTQAVQGQLDKALASERQAVLAAISDLGVAMTKMSGGDAAAGPSPAIMQELKLIEQSLGTLAARQSAALPKPKPAAKPAPRQAAKPPADPFVTP